MRSFGGASAATGHRGRGRLVSLVAAVLLVAGCGIFITDEPDTTRYGTAATLGRAAFPDGADVALLATGTAFADALAAAPLAASLDAPILLTQRDEVPDATSDALDELGVDDVVLLGGTGVIAEDVHDTLSGQYRVTRRAGTDRYETAATLAGEAFPDGSDTVLLATGSAFADALAAAPLAASLGAPILLTDRDALPATTLAALDRLGVSDVVLLGGTSVIGQRVEDALRQGPFEVTRHAGANRYETAATVAGQAFPDGSEVALVATGEGFADALAAAPLARSNDAPILLTAPDELPEATLVALEDLGVSEVLLLGGEAAVGADVEEALSSEYEVSRHAGEE